MNVDSNARAFYDRQYAGRRYAQIGKPERHSFYPTLKGFIDENRLFDKRCLEVGCGRGAFQDLVRNYVGVDISGVLGPQLHKPFCQCTATELPFKSDQFDAIWTYAVLEHVHYPEKALEEMRRVLKNNGLLLLAPAWNCRSWAHYGYPVRPFKGLSLSEKIVKASIPIRNSKCMRAPLILLRRVFRVLALVIKRRPLPFRFKELKPNYVNYWMSDSDARNSMDPYEAVLWFSSRGDRCISVSNPVSQFFIRTGPLVFQVMKENCGRETAGEFHPGH